MPESNPAGTPFPVTVKAVNITGAVDQSFTGMVKFYSTDPLAVLPQNAEFTASDKGVKTFTITLNSTGSHTVSISRTPDTSLVDIGGLTREAEMSSSIPPPRLQTAVSRAAEPIGIPMLREPVLPIPPGLYLTAPDTRR